MKNPRIIHKSLILAALMVFTSLVQAQNKRLEKNKAEIFRNLPGKGRVFIDSDMAKINISTAKTDSLTVNVNVRFSGSSDDIIEEPYKNTSIDISREGNRFRVAVVNNGPNSLEMITIGNKTQYYKVETNIDISMPENYDLDVQGDFSSLVLNKLSGRFTSDMDHGKLDIGELHHPENLIKGDYYRNSNIYFIKSGRIVSDFSRFNIGLTFNLVLNGDYTVCHIRRAKNLKVEGDFGKLNLERIKSVYIASDYRKINIKRPYVLYYSGDFSTLNIGEIPEHFKMWKFSGDYNRLTIANPRNVAFRYQIQKDEYTQVSLPGNKTEETGDDLIKINGYFKDPNAPGQMIIRFENGKILFK